MTSPVSKRRHKEREDCSLERSWDLEGVEKEKEREMVRKRGRGR